MTKTAVNLLDGLPKSLACDGASEPPPPENGGWAKIDQIRCAEFSTPAEQLTVLPAASSSSPMA